MDLFIPQAQNRSFKKEVVRRVKVKIALEPQFDLPPARSIPSVQRCRWIELLCRILFNTFGIFIAVPNIKLIKEMFKMITCMECGGY